jgi:hypothetical protein
MRLTSDHVRRAGRGETEETNMRKLIWAPAFAALLLAGAACKDQDMKLSPNDTNKNEVKPDQTAALKTEPSDFLSVTGQVAKANDTLVEVKTGLEPNLKLAVDDKTTVRIDGQQGFASQIAEGSDVRASYKSIDGKMTALRLDVTKALAKPLDNNPPAAKPEDKLPVK